MNKSLVSYSIISFIIIFFFGFNFLFSLLGNILILLFLTPILLIILAKIINNMGVKNNKIRIFPNKLNKKLNPKKKIIIKEIIL